MVMNVRLLARGLHGGGYGPHKPYSFFRKVFPFLNLRGEFGNAFPALMPTCQTIGSSWSWRIENLSVIPPILTTLKSRGFNKHFQSSVLEAHHQSLNEVARYYKSKAIELRSFERAQLIQTNANPATLALRFD